MLDRADCADFGCHNSIRLETKHFLNTLALTFISFSGRFVFAMQKHYLFFFASDPLVYNLDYLDRYILRTHLFIRRGMKTPLYKYKLVVVTINDTDNINFLVVDYTYVIINFTDWMYSRRYQTCGFWPAEEMAQWAGFCPLSTVSTSTPHPL